MLLEKDAETILMMKDEDILDQAESFAHLLHNSSEFQAFLNAQQAMGRDSDAQRAIRDFQQMQQKAQQARFFGGLKPDEMDRLRYLQKTVLETPAVKKFVQAQEQLVGFFQELAGIISETIEMDYSAACAPAGGCC
ncbi:MAG: YlbF family regulator [candidate division KSB1 bacterium]|nr:YlbF family regulator [candidate division KSB1 bacterium]